jgi:Methyltransferase domain
LVSSVNKIRYAVRASQAIVAEPFEGIERVLERVSEWQDSRRLPQYRPEEDWERELHARLDAPWPCAECVAGAAVWTSTVAELRERELNIGRGAFGGWDDGDPALVRAAWCAVRHLRPDVVVETGVARGLTSRAILEALEYNGAGQLWSIDLPPLLEHELAQESAAAVPRGARDRWTLLRGSSRRLLSDLVLELEKVDLFVHDSMHTTRNVLFELNQVWPFLTSKGLALIDDVERNAALPRFADAHREASVLVCPADDRRALFGCLIKA